MSLENTIFNHLLYNEEYSRKAIPFLKAEYFHAPADKLTFELIDHYVNKYNSFPTKEALYIDLSNKKGVNETLFKLTKETIQAIKSPDLERVSNEWILEQTERFCQDKALYNAISHSIKIIDDDIKDLSKGAIPTLLSDALSVSFDTAIGHDFLEDFEARFDFYHRKEERLPFDLDFFNKICKGGLPRKTLNILMAPSGVGKTIFLCHFAASNLLLGKNVLYISMEMAEEKIAERIDANLLDIPLDDLYITPKHTYDKKIARLKEKTLGKLIIKEYPTAGAGANNFRALLNELRIKKNFIPDVIYIDYLNICCSSRIKNNANANSYTIVKSIAEELRGLAIEFNVPIISATQTARSGYDSSDLTLTDTSESIGLVFTVDFMVGLIATEELTKQGQIMIKQLKNRYASMDIYNKFTVGIDKSRMRLYNLDNPAQENLIKEQDIPVFDSSRSGEGMFSKFNKNVFDDFK